MLTLEPARRPPRRRAGPSKLAIALAGGGPLGSFYELGALHALEEAIIGRELTAFDVYVGVSSGSVLAAALANGFDTTSIGALFIQDESTLPPFSPGMLLKPAFREFANRIALLPGALIESARRYARDPLRGVWPAAMSSLRRVAPTALFDNRPLERYLHTLFTSPDRSDDFRRLRSRLYLVATDLNTGEEVAFGDDRHERIAISRAVVASAALPGLYPPVEIGGRAYVDGALTRTMHASLALEGGCELVICINPLVPFDASRARGRSHANLADSGIDTILGQTFRALINSRMRVGMASYGARFPRADTILLEPNRHDEEMFFTNVFRYSGRQRLVEHAYQQTRRDLRHQADALAAVLRRHHLGLSLERLRDPRRSFASAARERAVRLRTTTDRLGLALARLETLLAPERRIGRPSRTRGEASERAAD
ncbi:MAG TPA: patatin-like phospholipase family protein [Steroidobacteraceae bacterium]|nr:patatin-like phospholipase family protein [Steroidobacteraceae bacterium]